ncbi:hypothetical protein [Tenacibaculum agarivorans]|uniref:hypothetical protein n=1 Tax=Tenacibaculum agarivorans TaxID=1908389 RepID=UPI00094B89A0|nr:hypothetical protein [Tenacibaculum agarivorans]
MRALVYLIILVFGISCNFINRNASSIHQNQIVLDSIYRVEKLDTTKEYRPLSLQYKGKALFKIGEKITKIDTTLSYRIDPNMDYQNYGNIITDYLTLDDYFTIDIGKHSSLNGIGFFSVDKKSKRIFNVSANWYFDLQENDMEQSVIDSITKRLFPVLKDKIQLKNNWIYKLESKNQIEIFKITNREINEGYNLDYEVKLK